MSTPTHSVAQRYTRAGYLGHLNAEWVSLLADQPVPAGRWDLYPSLQEKATLQSVLDAILDAPSETRDAILHALLSLAAQGDELAARTVLQTMLGTVQWLARTARSRRTEDHVSVACEAMWLTIRRYPLHRTSRVAANLKMDALKHLAQTRPVDVPVGPDLDFQIHQQQMAGRLGEPAQRDDDVDAAAVISWGQDHAVLSAEDAQLLALTYLGDSPTTLSAVAHVLDISPAAARQRHSRAVRKLASAVASSMAA